MIPSSSVSSDGGEKSTSLLFQLNSCQQVLVRFFLSWDFVILGRTISLHAHYYEEQALRSHTTLCIVSILSSVDSTVSSNEAIMTR